MAKDNSTVPYPANVYALTVKKEILNIKPICQFFLQRIKTLMSKIDVSWFQKALSSICNLAKDKHKVLFDIATISVSLL